MGLVRGKKFTFNVGSGKVLITSPQWSRDADFDLMHEVKACNGKWKSRAIMETAKFSDEKGLRPIGFEAWCSNISPSGRWRKLRKSAITDVAMIGVFDKRSYPRDKDKNEHRYWKELLPEIDKTRPPDRNFILSIDKESVIFETMSDGAYPVWVRERDGKEVDAVVISSDDALETVFKQKMFMDGDVPSRNSGKYKLSKSVALTDKPSKMIGDDKTHVKPIDLDWDIRDDRGSVGLSFEWFDWAPGYSLIRDLQVSEKRKGYGTSLVNDAVSKARESKQIGVILPAPESVEAKKFWESQSGWKPLNRRGYRGWMVRNFIHGPPEPLLLKSRPGKNRKLKSHTAADLRRECHYLWEHYCERPNKTRLRAVIKHCELMSESSAKSVKEERARCMRAARREMKKLGIK